jgi:hypothetical protein
MVSGAAGHEHDYRLVLDAPSDEGEHAGGGAIEPMRVVGDNHKRHTLGDLGEQLQHGERDQESVRRLLLRHAEGSQECRPLRCGQAVDLTEHRQHELVQPCERQLRLGLHPGRVQHLHTHILRAPAGRRQQGGLADALLAPYEQRRTTLLNPVDQPVELGQLALATEDGALTGAVRGDPRRCHASNNCSRLADHCASPESARSDEVGQTKSGSRWKAFFRKP